MDRGLIILGVVVVMLTVGVIAALVWWQMADVLFPGTARKTGQQIFPAGKKSAGPPPGAKVIRDFDSQPPDAA
jgi:flagellar basal body-associated protein FliL